MEESICSLYTLFSHIQSQILPGNRYLSRGSSIRSAKAAKLACYVQAHQWAYQQPHPSKLFIQVTYGHFLLPHLLIEIELDIFIFNLYCLFEFYINKM